MLTDLDIYKIIADMDRLNIVPLFTKEDIQKRVLELGKEIRQAFKGEPVEALCILKGGCVFFSDLVRAIGTDVSCNFISLSSYQGTQSTGQISLDMDVLTTVRGKNILIVEDIVDTGRSMSFLLDYLQLRKAKKVALASLLYKKPPNGESAVPVDFYGFKIKDEFVVGYGLDYNELFRELPFIGQLSAFN